MNYVQVEFDNINQSKIDMLVALLSELNYQGFEYDENFLKAFIPADDFDNKALEQLCDNQQINYAHHIIEEKNWNSEWEKNFEPVIINEQVSVRAAFHEKPGQIKFDIVITPKMSFGTGHHETTALMIEQMLEMDLTNKTVLDFGTGTGVLAILAEKLNATAIIAIDNDANCIENATENITANNCNKISVSDIYRFDQHYDIILANINKNTILEFLPVLQKSLKSKGILLLSGVLKQDENEINIACSKHNLSLDNKESKNQWLCMKFNSNII